MSDQGGSDLDVFENLSKKPGSPAGDSKQKTLLGLSAPPGARGSKAPPPPPNKSVPPPPSPSAATAPPPPAPSAAAAPPPPVPSGAVAPPPSAAMAPPPPTASQASAPPSPLMPPPTPSAAAAPPPPTAPVASSPSIASAPPPPSPSFASAPPPPAQSKAPPPPTPSAAMAPPPPPTASKAPPPPSPASAPEPSASESDESKPLVPVDTDWEDEDEKTTVFDRSHEESAQALLQKSPTPAAGAPATLTGMGKPQPSAPPQPPVSKPVPAPVSAPPPAPMPSTPVASAPQPSSQPSTSASAKLSSPPQTSVAAQPSAPAQAPVTQPPPASSKTGLFIGLAAVALLGIGAFVMMGGPSTGGLVVSVAGPGGKAVSGVKVLIDGQEKCADSTCKISELEPGSYVIKAVAEGYEEMAGKAYEVRAGEQTPINIELMGAAASTGLKVSSDAAGLTLSVDGKKIGPLPQALDDLEPGEHKIEISGNDLIKPFEETVTVKEGETLNFEPELELAMGNLIVKLGENAEGAKVALTVNGSRKSLQAQLKDGETEKIKIPSDGKRYTVSATKKGFEDFEEELRFDVENPVRTVTVAMREEGAEEPAPAPRPRTSAPPARAPAPTAPAPAPAAAAPAPKPAPSGAGKININSIPVSTVILDGRPLGTTPKIGVSVSAGPHTVVFVHPQHGRKVRQVNVSAGGVATAAVRFP